MTFQEKLQAIKNLIAPYVNKPVRIDEDFCVYDWCGGNVDDAYQLGVDDGERMLSQSIEAILEKE